MPSTDQDPINPGFERRLKASLDGITPPTARPRYESVSVSGTRVLPFAPVWLAAATAVLLALTATATTGSSNPAVWTQRAASTIESVGHVSQGGSHPTPTAGQPAGAPAAQPTPEPEHQTSPGSEPAEPRASADQGPSEPAQASPTPEPSESPSPTDGHSGTSSPSPDAP